ISLAQRARLHRHPPSFPTRRSSDLLIPPLDPHDTVLPGGVIDRGDGGIDDVAVGGAGPGGLALLEAFEHFLHLGIERVDDAIARSEEHTSELQSRENLVCRLLLEKK